MPFVREKIDPEWLPWVTKHAGHHVANNNGEWAIDHERNAAFFFEGGDPQDWSQPRNYRLKVGNDVFPVEILDYGNWRLRDGTIQIWIGPCYGAVTSRSEARQLVLEAYRCLHRLPTES